MSDLEAANRIRATGEYVTGQYGRPLLVWVVVSDG